MIPTGASATIEVSARPSATADAVAVFVAEAGVAAGELAAISVEGDSASASPLLAGDELAAVSRMIAAGVARGKAREVNVAVVDDPAAAKGAAPRYRRVITVGLGKSSGISAESVRRAAGALARAVKRLRLTDVTILLPRLRDKRQSDEAPLDSLSSSVEAVVSGILLAGFEYEEYKGAASRGRDEDRKGRRKPRYTLLSGEPDLAAAEAAAERARIICEGQNFARTIASRPGNDINPPTLAKVARELAGEVGLDCRVLDEKQLAKLKMGGILAVGAGSIASPPRLIVLEWKGGAGSRTTKGKSAKARPNKQSGPLLVVGKAITFDTGGISIKPSEKMGKMIFDKSGGMAVLGLMYAVAKLKLPVHVVGILSSAENAISSRAYRPGDLLRMYNGVTVDVTNTDAEGRLVLGDALAWGIETYKPSAVVDLATLTGAIVVALGYVHAGMFSNSDDFAAELTAAAQAAGEKVWRMPLGEEYRERIKGDAADIVNAAGRDGGCCTAAAFLSHFVPAEGAKDFVPWAHLDIAGMADTEKELPYYAKGSTGWGVRTLVELVRIRTTNKDEG